MRLKSGTYFGLSLFFTLSCKSRTYKNDSFEGGSRTNAFVSGLDSIPLFDVNDVSVMFPKSFMPRLDKFISKKDFDLAMMAGIGKGPAPTAMIMFSPVDSNIGNWKIVSFRYDPCAPGVHAAQQIAQSSNIPDKDAICQAQIRLIAQPFDANGSDRDVTFHLLYRVGKDASSIKEQITKLAAIKSASKTAGADTNGMPLSVHPGLGTEDKAVEQAVNDFLGLCDPNSLMSVAVMALANANNEPWIFYANSRAEPGGPLVNAPIPTVEESPSKPARFQALSFLGQQRILGEPSSENRFQIPGLPVQTREPIEPRSANAIFKASEFTDTNILPMTDARLEVLHAIDNPNTNHFFTMDCVSCHTSSNLLFRRKVIAGPSEEGTRIAMGAAKSRFITPPGITAYIRASETPTQASFQRPWSVRNFGYFNGRPTIALRTATETAEVLVGINREIMGRKEFGPNSAQGIEEKDFAALDQKIWSCIHFSSSNPSFDSCLKQAQGN